MIRHYGLNIKGDEFVRLAFEFAAAYASVKVHATEMTCFRGVGLIVDSVAFEDCAECLGDAVVCESGYGQNKRGI